MGSSDHLLFVPTAWLRARLDAPHVRVLDIRSARLRSLGRVPGGLDFDPLLIGKGDPVAVAFAMSSAGVSDDDVVVVYDQANAGDALRVATTLRRNGHVAAHVLHGGFLRWSNEGAPVTRETSTRRKPGSFTARAEEPRVSPKRRSA
jgi:3-mercaptopyruvate sulfurtransferase SseA